MRGRWRRPEDKVAVDPVDAGRQILGVERLQHVAFDPEGPLRDGARTRMELEERDGPRGRESAAQEAARPPAQRAGVQEVQTAVPSRVVGVVVA
jgi:hypothetical protein